MSSADRETMATTLLCQISENRNEHLHTVANSKSDEIFRHQKEENGIGARILTNKCKCGLNVGNDGSGSRYTTIDTTNSVNN